MKIGIILGFVLALGILTVGVVSAENVCCEKTISNLFCQNTPIGLCSPDATIRKVPTSCESTSYCKPGWCFDSVEGTCSDNTAQLVCNNEGGTWSEEKPAQCSLGCCTLGDQVAFVTLTRCKQIAGYLGLQTNYNSGIQDEVACVLSVSGQEKGACVFEREFEKTCKFTTNADCKTTYSGDFHVNKLCSAPELGTNCAPTSNTACLPGKDGVYYLDSCGNPANIYDYTKRADENDYWANVVTVSGSCGIGKDNANDKSCGNCNYLLGSVCREAGSVNPSLGEYICQDLNCKDTENGNPYKHGESWCVQEDSGTTGEGDNSVGSRFYKHICINGEEVIESCADFRQEVCIEDKIETSLGDFSQAACRVNRWQDCIAQNAKDDCKNTDRRDCLWIGGIKLQLKAEENVPVSPGENGACVPLDTPGIKFWDSEEAKSICSLGNAQCVVTYEKDLFGKEKCVSGCECLGDGWAKERGELCSALGDCGPKINWLGVSGYKDGYKVTITGYKQQSSG